MAKKYYVYYDKKVKRFRDSVNGRFLKKVIAEKIIKNVSDISKPEKYSKTRAEKDYKRVTIVKTGFVGKPEKVKTIKGLPNEEKRVSLYLTIEIVYADAEGEVKKFNWGYKQKINRYLTENQVKEYIDENRSAILKDIQTRHDGSKRFYAGTFRISNVKVEEFTKKWRM